MMIRTHDGDSKVNIRILMMHLPVGRRWLLAALTLFLVACAAPSSSRPVEPAPNRQAEAFSQIVTDLAVPTMEGRGPGTRGLELARDYVTEQFRRAGLKPAFGERFTQPFEITLGTEAVTQVLTINDRPATAGEQFNAMGFSASGAFAGETVFVGYGINNTQQKYNSFAGGEDLVRGRIAVAMRYEPMDEQGVSKWSQKKDDWSRAASLTSKARWAAEHGATALILINVPAAQVQPLRTTRETSDFEAATIPVFHADPAVFGERNWRDWQQAADRGELKPVLLPDVKVSGEVKLTRKMVTVENVAGLIPGAGPLKDEVIVIGAHYDHLGYGEFGSMTRGERAIHPGADDNASGTAALILTARRFSRFIETPRRTLLFIAFSGEERGLLGSNWFLTHLGDANLTTTQLAAMINMDMVGRMQEKKLYVLGVGSGEGWRELVKESVKDAGLVLTTDTSPLGASDHASFYLHKVPAIHLFTGVHAEYHRPTDTAEKINGVGGAAVVDCVEQLASALATQPQRIAFNSEGAKLDHATRAMGKGAYLGIMPDYGTMSGDQGCGISALSPASPAQEAGIQAGDLIVQWNQTKIGNVYDLTRTLGEAQPESVVTLKIKRGNDTLDIPVKLGKR